VYNFGKNNGREDMFVFTTGNIVVIVRVKRSVHAVHMNQTT